MVHCCHNTSMTKAQRIFNLIVRRKIWKNI